MDQSHLKSGNNTVIKSQGNWNVDTIANQIFRDLNGTMTLSTIHEVLKDVIPKYESARIQIYVPIFIRRDAVNQLLSMPATFVSPDMVIDETDGRVESLANSDLSQHIIAPKGQDKTIGTSLVRWKPAT